MDGEQLGPTPKELPFDRAVSAQWRCYWPFGGGMFTDLFVHQTTHLIAAMGVRYPARVVGGGGIYLEYDGRDVPDVATVVADYDEGCQVLVTATMCNDHRIEECIRGHSATLVFDNFADRPEEPEEPRQFGYKILPQNVQSARAARPARSTASGEVVFGGLQGRRHLRPVGELPGVRSRRRTRSTFSTPELGAAAFTTVNMGVLSYRYGKALFWDKEKRKPVEADASRGRPVGGASEKRGKPNHIIGWKGGDKGSMLNPPDYQKLEGPWVDGKDPAGGLSNQRRATRRDRGPRPPVSFRRLGGIQDMPTQAVGMAPPRAVGLQPKDRRSKNAHGFAASDSRSSVGCQPTALRGMTGTSAGSRTYDRGSAAPDPAATAPRTGPRNRPPRTRASASGLAHRSRRTGLLWTYSIC